jgi:hypothetical protein
VKESEGKNSQGFLNAESSDPSADLKCEKLKISFLVSGEDWASSLS